MAYENIFQISRTSTRFCIKIHSTTFETSLLQKNKHDMYCIIDIVKKFIQYMLSPEGQVKSAQMAAYPGFAITKSGRAKLIEVDRKEAERTGQIGGMANDPITLVKEGRIHYRNIPVQQSLEDWNDFWSEYKNAWSFLIAKIQDRVLPCPDRLLKVICPGITEYVRLQTTYENAVARP